MKFNEYLTELRKRKFDTSKKINDDWFNKHVEVIGLYSTKEENALTKENLKNRLNESFKDVLKDSKKQIKVKVIKNNKTQKKG